METKWRDKFSVVHPDDHSALDMAAAVHEFRGGLTKEESEKKAHTEYLRSHALDSAAYHYLGMRGAMATGNVPAAKRHGVAYSTVMKHLGVLNPLDSPPKEVTERAKDLEKNPYSFKEHKADGLFSNEPEIPEMTEKEKTMALIEKLKSLGKTS